MSDFEIDFESLFVEPRPDEDAWEAFLGFALERLDGPKAQGLTNAQLDELEGAIGCQLPFEVGLLLVMGVPTADGWWQWDQPAAQWTEWNNIVIDRICFDVEHDDFWFHQWGPKPADLAERIDITRSEFATNVPPLFPLFGHRAMPLVAAEGKANSDGNPVFSVYQTDVIAYGDDLAAWMHKEFEVPLPMWPAEQRRFPFWSDLIELE